VEPAKDRRIINSVAPMRICDLGGWTDTWFAGHGCICNLAVYPHAEVQLRVVDRAQAERRITIHAENYRDRYSIELPGGIYDKHPLLEAAMDFMDIPEPVAIDVSIYSECPAGASTGTSAAVSVALIGALDCLTPGRMAPHETALAAHRIETELLGQQCGIQDQIASACGGINYIDMHAYPRASVSQIRIDQRTWWELESRLALVFVGRPHASSKVHEMVIASLRRDGPDAEALGPLRQAARDGRDALYAGDLAALGRVMTANTEAQRRLHPRLISPGHQQIIDIAAEHDAWGWKVNGAGGDGGSVSILAGPDRTVRRRMLQAVTEAGFDVVPITLCPYGLRTWLSAGPDRQPEGSHT
jgi:D-glycero-alpha-D-manno-heptose-7-phosphate kinase